jgi:hypothetical protein
VRTGQRIKNEQGKIDSKIFKDGSLRVTLAPVKFFGKEGQTQVKNQAEEAKSCEVGA